MSELPVYDLNVVEGEDYSRSMTWKEGGVPVSLAGYEFEGQIRSSFEENAPVLSEITITCPEPESGEFFITIPAAALQGAVSVTGPRQSRTRAGFYDIFYTVPSGGRYYLVGGRVNIEQTVTKGGAS